MNCSPFSMSAFRFCLSISLWGENTGHQQLGGQGQQAPTPTPLCSFHSHVTSAVSHPGLTPSGTPSGLQEEASVCAGSWEGPQRTATAARGYSGFLEGAMGQGTFDPRLAKRKPKAKECWSQASTVLRQDSNLIPTPFHTHQKLPTKGGKCLCRQPLHARTRT